MVDALRKAEIGVSLIGVVITGDQASPAGTGSGVTAARFEVDRPRCREWDALRRELSVVRLEGRGTKGKKSQDDLAFALALAVWWSVRL